jgi:hypothetical protein
MGFIIDTDTSDVKEFVTVPAEEYQVRCLAAEMKNSQKGDPMLVLRFDIPAEPLSKDIFMNIMLPTSNDDKKRKAQKLLNLRDLKSAFNIPQNVPLSDEELIGKTPWAILTEEDDAQYGKRNNIKRFVVGR